MPRPPLNFAAIATDLRPPAPIDRQDTTRTVHSRPYNGSQREKPGRRKPLDNRGPSSPGYLSKAGLNF